METCFLACRKFIRAISEEKLPMRNSVRIFVRNACLGLPVAVSALLTGVVGAVAYPDKAIDLVVAWAPGGSTDTAARVAAKHLASELGVPVNVVNKGGGAGVPGVISVVTARPDGYTLLWDVNSDISGHAIKPNLPYKWDDRTFGPMMVQGPMALIVSGKSEWDSLKKLVNAAKADPSAITWAYLGAVSITTLTQVQIFEAAGSDVTKTRPVSFDSGSPGITAIAGGHVKLGAFGVGGVLPLTKSGDLKVLAVTGARRVTSLPDVPTSSEAGFPEINLSQWWCITGPKGLPQEIVKRLDEAAKKITNSPEFQKDLAAINSVPHYMSPSEVRNFATREMTTLQALSTKTEAKR